MNVFFVPYSGRKVATVDIKGQRVVILSTDRDAMTDGLHLLGADRVKTLVEHNPIERETLFSELASKSKSNLVIAPENVELEDVLSSLEAQLVWVQ